MSELIHILAFVIILQFPPDTQYSPIYVPFPELPSFNEEVIDSSTMASIIRITDYDSTWEWYPRHAYSKIQTWNIDMSMYKFYSVAIYNGSTHQKIMDLPDIYYTLWSNIAPDILYSFRIDGVIQTFNVTTGAIDTLLSLHGFDLMKVGPGEGNIDNFDRLVALACKKDTDLVVVVVDLQDGEIVTSRTFNGAWGNGEYPLYVDWVSVSQSGEYVGIMWDHNRTSPTNPFDGHYGVEIYDAGNLSFLRRLVDYGNHGDFCFTPDGNEVFVQFYGEGGTINAYGLDDGHHTVIHRHPDFGYGDTHISCRNIHRPGWAYVSTDPSRGGMIVAVKLDGSEHVELFGHHFSSAFNYVKSPMPVPSPDGRMVMFNSDFGDSLDPEIVYVFVSQYHPAGIDEEISGNGAVLYKDNTVYLDIPSVAPVLIKILNPTGRVVMEKPFRGPGKFRVPLNDMSSGVYFILINSSDGVRIRKFVILD